MLNSKNLHLFIITLPFLFLSCWGDSTPTSDNSKTFVVGGKVTDKNGTGVNGVTVQITGTNYSAADTTDSEGAFTFNNIKVGDYKIKAMKDSCFFKPSKIDFTVGKTDIDTLKFTSAENYIHGRVLDIMTDKGIAGVEIQVHGGKTYSLIDSTISESDGEYCFFDIVKGNYDLLFRNSSYTHNFSLPLESTFFTGPEITLQNCYFSSEKIEITVVEYNEISKNVHLEWTGSKSPYFSHYQVNYSNYPSDYKGPGKGSAVFEMTNHEATIEITRELIDKYFEDDLISGELFFFVRAVYKKSTDPIKINYYSPYSNNASVRLNL